MRKRVKCKTNHEKSEEKNEFGSLWNESLGSNVIPQSCLDLKICSIRHTRPSCVPSLGESTLR